MNLYRFTLNGQPVEVHAEPDQPLLEILREQFKIVSVKSACAPQGQCGACLCLVGGVPRTSCGLAIRNVEGKNVLTLEGVSEEERQLYAKAFQIAAGLQCGFCTPGLVLRIKWLTDRARPMSRQEMAEALNGHICRCTGYVKVLDAMELIYAARHEGKSLELAEQGRVGEALPRYRGAELALGEQPFIADIDVPGLLHGAVALSPHARARVVSINTAKAEALPGVVRVATAKDVPGDRWVGQIYKDWPCFIAEGEEVRYVGDVLAAIAAENPRIAREAAQLIEVDYEVLPAVLDAAEALQPGAPQVNPRHDNVLSKTVIQRGDVDAALAASAHTVSGTWRTQRIEHMFLEPEAALAIPLPDGRLHLYTQGQGIFEDRRQVAAVLGEPATNIFVELAASGGAFGGKEDLAVQAQTALLARLTSRPVRIELNREESVRMHPKRHPMVMDYTVGCDAEGRLTAARIRVLGDSGAYASVGGKVLERSAGHACGAYRLPVIDIEAIAAYTNNPPCGAMRGFGVNQTNFAIEGCLDLLAEKVGIDGWEMRWRNGVRVGDMFSSGQVLEKSVGLERTLLAVKESYYEARAKGRAVGIACGVKNSGIGNGAIETGECRMVVEEDGSVSLYSGFTEMGQGLLTVIIQFAVETTGLAPSVFRPRVDSTFEIGSGATTGSRGTLLAGRATLNAAQKLKADLDAGFTLADLIGRTYEGHTVIDDTTAPGKTKNGKIKTHTTYGWSSQVVVLDEEGVVDFVHVAQDVGRIINPQQCEAQLEGSIHMGLGYALTEELPCKDGMPVAFSMRDLGILRAKHMPKVKVTLVEEHEPEGPCGAKGLGELGLVPTPSALAGALAAFDGKRRMSLPMKDSPAAQAIDVGELDEEERALWH